MSSWSLEPTLVWGLYLRALGVVLFITFLSLSLQIVGFAGSQSGPTRIAPRLLKYREDFPGWRRFVYFPTLLWINSSDGMLRLLSWGGLACAALVVYGGPFSHYALIGCYVCYVSLDLPAGLVLPWDCLLFEVTLFSCFLPVTHALPELTAVAAPSPALAWAFRLLFFRLMFGFGKQKFLGSRPKDSAYLRGFFIYQPLLSPLGWLAHKLPLSLLKGGLYFMFLVEIPTPFFVFFPGALSVIAAAATVMLMIGIQITGNFGYFSIATMALCIPLLDNVTPHAFTLSGLFAPGAPIVTNAYVVLHTCAAVFTFPFNSWLGQSWCVWSVWYRFPRFLQPLFGFYRLLHPLRWLHPYGVFPPNNQPGVKMSLVPEVSWDGQTWHELQFKYAPTNERSRPHFVAPHHPRGDQAIVYDTFGLNSSSLMSGMVGLWDPYYFASASPAVQFCQRAVEVKDLPYAWTDESKRHDGPPIASRITTVMLEPTTLEELRRSGRWWDRTYIGPHTPTHHNEPNFWENAIGEPELWHPEAIMWRRRSRFHDLMERSRAGKTDPLELAIWDGKLTRADVDAFWSELVPLVANADRTTFDSLPDTLAAIRTRFDRTRERAFARLLGRFAMILVARFEPKFLYKLNRAELHAPSYLHVWMLAYHIIAQGKDAYVHALAHEESWNAELAKMTTQSGLYFLALFRFDDMCFDAQKLRLIDCVTFPLDPVEKRKAQDALRTSDPESLAMPMRAVVKFGRFMSGFFWVMTDLRFNFKGPAFHRGFPELYPEFEELDSGDIRVKSYAYPSPDEPLSPDIKSLRSSASA